MKPTDEQSPETFTAEQVEFLTRCTQRQKTGDHGYITKCRDRVERCIQCVIAEALEHAAQQAEEITLRRGARAALWLAGPLDPDEMPATTGAAWAAIDAALKAGEACRNNEVRLEHECKQQAERLKAWENAADEFMVTNWIGVYDKAEEPKRTFQYCIEHALDQQRDQQAEVIAALREQDRRRESCFQQVCEQRTDALRQRNVLRKRLNEAEGRIKVALDHIQATTTFTTEALFACLRETEKALTLPVLAALPAPAAPERPADTRIFSVCPECRFNNIAQSLPELERHSNQCSRPAGQRRYVDVNDNTAAWPPAPSRPTPEDR